MRRIIIGMCVLALVVGASAAFGQAQKGTIKVSVTDDDGGVLPGATVSAESDQTLSSRTAFTNERGEATLVGLDPARNYVVTVSLDGFNGARFENVVVRAGATFELDATLSVATVKEELVVTAEAPIVDVTSSIAGQDITLQLTESLPTARSYQDYLQLVPGVMPAVDRGNGPNPASRSGLNYRDVGGEVGQSRDNYYYIEGINVTDGVQGFTRTTLNTEIIQEQSVLTGGLPAEFVGAPGLVSNVITKSGGNDFSGSVNFYFQNEDLVADSENEEDQTFKDTDAAVTFGGPLVRDKAWFFASFRNTNREDDFIDRAGRARTAERDNDQAFVKLSFAPSSKDLITGVFLTDPLEVSGQNDPTQLITRDFSQDLGGERLMLNYSRVFEKGSLELGFTDHDGDLDIITAINAAVNDVSFRSGDNFTQFVDEQLGGQGDMDFEVRGTENIRASYEAFFDTGKGSHSLKFGVDFAEYTDFRDANFATGFGDFVSLGVRYLGDNITNTQIVNSFTILNFNARNPSDYDGFIDSFNLMSPTQQAAILAAYDRGCSNPMENCVAGDGVVDPGELGDNMVFNSTAGNPDGQINYGRREQLSPGAATTSSEGTTGFIQDNWQFGRWSINAGLRTEEWEHFASTGESVFTFDTEIAPRVSIAYDLNGDGKSRLSLYFGRYYDPIRNNATNFVGSLTTRVLEEQVWVDAINDWVSFRTRGGQSQLDATFAPTTETPFTDELQLSYKRDIGSNMSIEANAIIRETDDIIEDYDFGLYTDPSQYPGPITGNTLFLGESFFGFPTTPTSNFNIGTLPDGNFRDWDGLELIFRKRYADNWQMIASYNYADAEGNTNSDSNFDFAGDVLWLDPRAPNMTATQAGLIEHLFKVAGSYNFDNGLQLGGAYRWNSGAVVNFTTQSFRRNNPFLTCDVTTESCQELHANITSVGLGAFAQNNFEAFGFTDRWVTAGSIGTHELPSYGVFDVRVSYLWNIGDRLKADFFLDIFNILDEQKAVQIEDRVITNEDDNGVITSPTGSGTGFLTPQRFFLGARLRF